MEEVSDSEKDAQDEQGADLAVSSLTRAPYGSKTVFNNGYFTLSHDRSYGTAFMCVHRRLCTPAELGIADTSRRFVTTPFDGSQEPVRTYLVLRAWMLWRASIKGWAARHEARKKLFEGESRQLRRDIQKMEELGGGTGCVHADNCIKSWWPSALA